MYIYNLQLAHAIGSKHVRYRVAMLCYGASGDKATCLVGNNDFLVVGYYPGFGYRPLFGSTQFV